MGARRYKSHHGVSGREEMSRSTGEAVSSLYVYWKASHAWRADVLILGWNPHAFTIYKVTQNNGSD